MKKHMGKKKVLLLCQYFYPEQNSSATLPFDTAVKLSDAGMEVDVLCGRPKEYTSETNVPLREKVNGISIHRVRYAQPNRKRVLGRLVNYFSFTLRVLFSLREIGSHDVVIVYSNPPILPMAAALANRFFHTKIIFVAYDIYPEIALEMKSLREGSIIDRVMRRINRSVFTRASGVVAMTEEMRENLVRLRPEIAPERIVTIHNWAHEGTVSPNEGFYRQFGYSPDDFIISYFGNMGVCQEMDTLMDAAESLNGESSVKFLIAGHGSKAEAIKKRAESLENVQVMEFLTGEDFEKALSISSCGTVTLEPHLGGLCAPSKYYSYLQAGKAVLSVTGRDSYLVDEITGKRLGAAVACGDSAGLAEAIRSLAADRGECAAMGERARKVYNNYYDKKLGVAAYERLCRKVLEEETVYEGAAD